MKKLITFIVCSCIFVAIYAQTIKEKTIILEWNYPTNLLPRVEVFKLYHSTNITIPLTNWAVFTHIPGVAYKTNLPVTVITTNNYKLGTNNWVKIKLIPGEHYFALTASNYLGESDFSNTCDGFILSAAGELKAKKDD